MSVMALGFAGWGAEGRSRLVPDDLLEPHWVWALRFGVGVTLVVILPLAILRWWGDASDDGERSLQAWGFGLGDWKRGLPLALGLSLAGGAVFFFFVSKDPAMHGEYPLFAPGPPTQRIPVAEFVTYEAIYFLFFLTGEGAMRGILLFGLERRTNAATAIAITTLVQVVWHTGKPVSEMLSAPVWGLLVGIANLRLKSMWWMLIFHWVTNVILDFAIYYYR